MNASPTLKRSLTLKHVILFGLSFMAPVTVFATYGVAIEKTNGMIPTAYAIALFVMLLTAYSYGKLVQEYPTAGSSYTFTQKAINPHIGFLVGWGILLDYLFSPMISALLVGVFASSYFPAIPMPVWIVLFITVVTVVNIIGIKFAANFNTYMVIFQILFIVLFCLLSAKGLMEGKGTGELFSMLPFFSPDVQLSALLGVVPLLCFTFLGFDAVATLSEETNQPKTTLPKAIFLVPLIGGVLYILVTYLAQTVFPNIASFKDPESAAMDILFYVGGNFLTTFFLAVTLTAGFASAVASGGSAARILYAMGREHILPNKVFGYISPRFHTPVYNILIISAIALSSMFLDIVTATSFINFGALFAFVFVNLSVIAHYFIRKKKRSGRYIIAYLMIPLVGALITFLFLIKLDVHSLILGGSWLTLGFIYLLYLTKLFTQRPPEMDFEDSDPILSESDAS
ncbi:APC family permease [Aneurinibacillus migulanus]|uniref:APC family permease n=1 Tax=Aneurinibacillus migulanus TaxID=47500 RepID=UPI00209E292E|nr:APC family permease [Aneurinibacillus migulanus]MCP1357734.1 APC family permease [Aneurinibacillus migulanus]